MVITVSDLSRKAIVSNLSCPGPVSLSPGSPTTTMVMVASSVSPVPVPVPESASSALSPASPHRHSLPHPEQLSLLSHLSR